MAGAVDVPTAARRGWVAGHPLTAPAQGRLRALMLSLPPAALALGLGASALGGHLALGGDFIARAPAAAATGAVAFAFGWVTVVWSAWLLRAAGTPLGTRAMPLQLIEEGPYRFSRHPMYLGLVAMLLGAALAFGLPLLVLAAVAFMGMVSRVHVPHEEAQLLARFGGWHRDYVGATRRWL